MSDDSFILGNFELFLNNICYQEFIDNLFFYENKLLQYKQSNKPIFECQETTLDEINSLFPILIH